MDRNETIPIDRDRRRVLGLGAGVIASLLGIGVTTYLKDQPYQDADGDGIPDPFERSVQFNRRLATVFGDGVDALNPDRRDLLIDVRYVGDTSVSPRVKTYLEGLFRENGIYAQWLDHPASYDENVVRNRYGTTVEDIVAKPRGFYWSEVEPFLRDTAFQVIVVPPGTSTSRKEEIYSSFLAEHFGGMNFGNRAVVVQQDGEEEMAELVLHEIAHLVLYHDYDPDNPGVMGQGTEIDLTDREWAKFRDGLHNIRDTTGYDVAFRRRLWTEQFDLPSST